MSKFGKKHEKKGRKHTYIRPKQCVWRRLGRFHAEFECVGRPANPRLGGRVWPGVEKPNPYAYPAVPGRVEQPVTIPSPIDVDDLEAVLQRSPLKREPQVSRR